MNEEEQQQNSNKMKKLIINLLKELKCSTVVQIPEFRLANGENIYNLAYELGRQMYLNPTNVKSLFTEEEKQLFKQVFPIAFVNQAYLTPGYVNNLRPDQMTHAKRKLSVLYFLKNEIFDLYNQICEADKNSEIETKLKDAIAKLNECIEDLDDKVTTWSDPDYQGGTEEWPEDEPNLNGVPQTHHWWTEEQRELWKKKISE
jgi:hypothetical protein